MRVATRVRLHSAKPVRRILPPKFTLDNLNSLLSRRLYVSSQRFVSICVELRTGFLLPTSPCDLHALTGAHPASAQVLYGSIVGNVVDQNGSAIPGAAVIATNQNTGVAASTTTNGVGEYNFVTLQAGTFTIKVAVAGFKTFERRDLVVEANNITRTDVKLQVGSMEQSVTVSGEAPVLQTDRAETRANVTSVELENLPVPLGRNYQQLYRTLPGVAPPFNSHSIPTNPSVRWNF